MTTGTDWKSRLNFPPKPSTPKEAPWRELEAVIDALGIVTAKLDAVVSAILGIEPGGTVSQMKVIIPNKAAWRHGQQDVTTAGTPVQLRDLPIPDGYPVTIVAKPGNNGTIYLGVTEAEITDTLKRFDGLSAGLAHSLRVTNLKEIWVDASDDGDGISWSVEYDS